jgi:hypothetical protein
MEKGMPIQSSGQAPGREFLIFGTATPGICSQSREWFRSGFSIARPDDPKAIFFEIVSDQLNQVSLVVNNQHVSFRHNRS